MAQPVSVEAAKKEGKVFVYGTIIPQVMGQIEKGFEAKYGINIEYWRGDATKVVDRVLTEWRTGTPGFDVVIGARGPLSLAKADGVYAKFMPASAANFPAKFKDRDGQLSAWRVTPVGILYNTEGVKPADVPSRLTNCLIPSGKARSACPIRRVTPAQQRTYGTYSRSKETNGWILCAPWRNRNRFWWSLTLQCLMPLCVVRLPLESHTFNTLVKPKVRLALRP
jgi:hypothetical protein